MESRRGKRVGGVEGRRGWRGMERIVRDVEKEMKEKDREKEVKNRDREREKERDG